MISKPVTTPEFDVQSVLGIMDVVDTMRSLEREVKEHLNQPQKIEALKKQLRERYSLSGIEVTDGQLDKAITDYSSRRWEFEEPRKGLGYKLAFAYVKRGWIATRIGIPTLALAVAIPTGDAIIKAGIRAAKRSAERSVENSIEGAYTTRKDLELTINKILSSPTVSRLPSYEADQVKNIAVNSGTQLSELDSPLTKLCPDGVSDDVVTIDNYIDMEQSFSPIKSRLDGIKSELAKANNILDTQERLDSTKKSLDALIEEIRLGNPPNVLKQQAEALYAQGAASFQGRQLREVESYLEQLSRKKVDIAAFAELPARLDLLYNSIKTIAKEDAAVGKAEKVHNEARSYVESANIERLRSSIQELEFLESALNEEYTMVVVGGDERYWKGDPNSPSVYYLKIEAHDSNGRKSKISIKDAEQDGKVESVTQWGEHVPQNIYEGVKKDKLDDGVIDNKIFGRKQRGYLTESIVFTGNNGVPLKRTRQVTLWEK